MVSIFSKSSRMTELATLVLFKVGLLEAHSRQTPLMCPSQQLWYFVILHLLGVAFLFHASGCTTIW